MEVIFMVFELTLDGSVKGEVNDVTAKFVVATLLEWNKFFFF